MRKPHENPAIGVLLCASKDSEVVEYALSRTLSPALVAQYQTQLPDKQLLAAKLHEFYALNAPEVASGAADAPGTQEEGRRDVIADLKPYPEYKESGSRWLGECAIALGGAKSADTDPSTETSGIGSDLPLLSVAREKGVFVRSLTDTNENHNVIPEDLSNYKVARAGSLVINKMKAWQGSMGIVAGRWHRQPGLLRLRLRDREPRTSARRLLRSKPYVAHFGQASDGVRVGQWDLTDSGMRTILCLVPPPDEQAAIVRFLDWANGRLERAIRAKRKVIALLNEQKQAIIHRAVTRGLDPPSPSNPPASPGSATFRSIGRCGGSGTQFDARRDSRLPSAGFVQARAVYDCCADQRTPTGVRWHDTVR